jgi:hypothetical protein
MKILSALLLLTLGLSPLVASAQWQWLDNDGKRVFSDRAPGAEIPAKNILKQPGGLRPVASSVVAPAAPVSPMPNAGSSAPKLAKVDKDLETKKKQADDAEVAKRKADEDRVAKAKAENCARAKQSQATFNSGRRMARTNASGEIEVLDDAGRTEEMKHIQSVMSSDCS